MHRQDSGIMTQSELPATGENRAFLTEQLITYIGNKRTLLRFIGEAVGEVRAALGKEKLVTADMFSGSGVVSRFLKQYSSRLIANDLEEYSEVINTCYLANVSGIDLEALRNSHRMITQKLENDELTEGIISGLYAPKNDDDVQPGERVFYTRRNARYLDTARALIDQLPREQQIFFLGPLLSEASVHANTSGVFKGFYKHNETGIGKFGGTNGDALQRIKGDITLPFPVFSRFECDIDIYREDANRLAGELAGQPGKIDLAYLDPPYNQHPYGSNYFMLNLLLKNRDPGEISRVSGIPGDWNRSDYNKRRKALQVFGDLVRNLDARFLLVSFNSEGFIKKEDMLELLSAIGRVRLMETSYNTFRGSRNLRNRNIHVKEYLYLVEK